MFGEVSDIAVVVTTSPKQDGLVILPGSILIMAESQVRIAEGYSHSSLTRKSIRNVF